MSENCICKCGLLIKPVNKNVPLQYRLLIIIANIVLTPALLVYYSFTIYLLPCLSTTIKLCFRVHLFPKCCLYTDDDFPTNNTSIGKIESKFSSIYWNRLKDMVKKDDRYKNAVLFDDNIVAEDVCQGSLGDCWLLAAFATLCEKKVFIQNCFLTRSYNPFGKYRLRFYDQKKRKFVIVDDYIPCDKNGFPLFTKFNGHEMWPLLLEKAYAKFKGSYAAIEGGIPLTALKELTGYEGEHFSGPFDEVMFKRLENYHDRGCLMAAGSSGKDNTRITGRGTVKKNTIVPGHAYSILDIKTPMFTTSRIQLIKLRNPWGTLEWDGDWGDSSPLWEAHPGVAFQIGRKHAEDGIFWMSWQDFRKYFDMIDAIYPNSGMDNLHYRVVEHDVYCGTCRGFCWGCFKYWLCCKGLRYLWFEKTSHDLKYQLQHDELSFFSIV